MVSSSEIRVNKRLELPWLSSGLRPYPSNAGGMGSIPGQGTKITACCTDRAPPKKAESTPPAKKEVLAKSLQLCPTPCHPIHCSLPGSSVHGFSRQEYWSWLPCHPLGDLPNPGMEPASHVSSALEGSFFTTCTPWKVPANLIHLINRMNKNLCLSQLIQEKHMKKFNTI